MAPRRSASAQTLGGEGPDAAQLDALLRLAARAPDHGKMTPWRFVVLREHKAAFVERLRRSSARSPTPPRRRPSLAKIAAPPLAVAVLSAPREGGKPVWEQQLSAGAVCMNLLLAAEAMGFGANWITDWYGYDPRRWRSWARAKAERAGGLDHAGHALRAAAGTRAAGHGGAGQRVAGLEAVRLDQPSVAV